MWIKLRSRILAAAVLVAALSIVCLAPSSSLYRGYVAGRASGALVFSIVQAIGTQAVQPSPQHAACGPRKEPGVTERLLRVVQEQLIDLGLQPRRS